MIRHNSFFKWMIGFSLLLGLLFIHPQLTKANDDLSFTMSVKPVENQIDKQATYYDLMVKPGMKQDLTVVVNNTGEKNKKIRITPTNAITNQNGLIDYSIQEKSFKNDSTLTHPFTSLVGAAQTVEIAPNEQKEVVFLLQVPETPFNGIILGGFVADLVESEASDENKEGVKIVNKFQLVKAVSLRENDQSVSPELVLNDVKPALVSYRTAITANLQNTQPVMFGKMTIDAKISKKGQSNVLKSKKVENLEMAPNSNFDFPISWENDPLDPGTYVLNLVATSGKKEWKFSKEFIIEAKDSQKLNNEAVDLNEKETPWLLYLLIAIVILLLLVIVFLIWKKKKDDRDKAQFF